MKQEKPLIAIDADVNQGLGRKLDVPQSLMDSKMKIGDPESGLKNLKKLLRGSNPLIPDDLKLMIKTILPGPGSHMIKPQSTNDPILDLFGVKQGLLTLINVGEVSTESHMHRCYRAQTGEAELTKILSQVYSFHPIW